MTTLSCAAVNGASASASRIGWAIRVWPCSTWTSAMAITGRGQKWGERRTTRRIRRDSPLCCRGASGGVVLCYANLSMWREVRRKIGTIYEGTTNMQLQTIAKYMLR